MKQQENKMTIEELREEKRKTEKEIADILERFQEKTELSVLDVNIEMCLIQPQKSIVKDVCIDVHIW
jgi:hypothetical protein